MTIASRLQLASLITVLAGSLAGCGHRPLLDQPVPVLTDADAGIFPERWRQPPIHASARPMSDRHRDRARKVLERALARYPRSLLDTHLEAVHLVGELRYSGISAGGTNSRTRVYVEVGEVSAGYTDDHIERTFHAEFSSILLRNHADRFEESAWLAANQPGFAYLGSGVAAIREGSASTRSSRELHAEGFLNRYGRSTLENDFNGFASSLFTGDPELTAIAETHERIARKRALAIAFFRSLDPSLEQAYFDSLARDTPRR